MIKNVFPFIFIFFLFITFSIGEVVEKIVAIVNEDIITLSDLKRVDMDIRIALSTRYQGKELEEKIKESRETLLEDLIQRKLLLAKAKEDGMNVESETKMVIENILKENNLNNEKELEELMRNEGIIYQAWKEELKINLLQQKVIRKYVDANISVDNAELLDYYRKHKEEFIEPEEVTLKGIFLEEKEGVEGKMKEIENELKEKSFEDVATTYSEGPEKERKGDMGVFKKGEMEKSLEEKVFSMKEKEISQWIKTPKGYYLIKVEGKKEAKQKSFEEARDEIFEKIIASKREPLLKKFFEELKAKSYIKILVPDPFSLLME
ncbi:MAG: peptidylprolyl isomerase [Candidatus Aminicenantia bacterium]